VQAVGALGVDTARLNTVFAALPLPRETSVGRERDPQWRATFGYDYWQIERTIAVGTPPGTWTRLEGRFDPAAIGAALAAAGHQPVAYGGATILTRGGDAQILNLDQPFARLTLAALNRVVLDTNSLTATPYTALAQAGIDAEAGRTPSFAADPEYAALVAALGPVVGARLLSAEGFYRQTVPNPRATASATRTADPNRPTLRPYRLVGLGLRDDGRTHAMVIGLLYASAADANADAPLLRQRATDYVLLNNGQPLREHAVTGEPEIIPAGRGATVVLPLAIAREADLGLWERMLAQRDYGFLAA